MAKIEPQPSHHNKVLVLRSFNGGLKAAMTSEEAIGRGSRMSLWRPAERGPEASLVSLFHSSIINCSYKARCLRYFIRIRVTNRGGASLRFKAQVAVS